MCLENWRACQVEMRQENTHIIALLTIEATCIPKRLRGLHTRQEAYHVGGGLQRRQLKGPAHQARAAYHVGGGLQRRQLTTITEAPARPQMACNAGS